MNIFAFACEAYIKGVDINLLSSKIKEENLLMSREFWEIMQELIDNKPVSNVTLEAIEWCKCNRDEKLKRRERNGKGSNNKRR